MSRIALKTIPLLSLLLVSPAGANDDVERSVLDAFNALVRDVQPLAEREPDAAIARYEEALLDGPTKGFGRLHLRIAQIHQKLGRSADAAHHYRECLADERVDPIDRKFLCQDGFEQVTGTLTLNDLSADARVVVLEPSAFAGAHRSGDRLPRGTITLVLEVPGHTPNRTTVTVDGPTVVRIPPGLPLTDAAAPDPDLLGVEVAPADDRLPRWPAYAALGVGLATVIGGISIGVSNRDSLDDIRARQVAGTCGADICRTDLDAAQTRAALADGMWISGATLAASGVVWWLLTGQGEP